MICDSTNALVHGESGSEATVRDSLDELRLVIHSLDPGLTEVPALLAVLRARLEPTLERRGIRFRWRVGDAVTPKRCWFEPARKRRGSTAAS